jgi:hypothetical protein
MAATLSRVEEPVKRSAIRIIRRSWVRSSAARLFEFMLLVCVVWQPTLEGLLVLAGVCCQ